MMRPRCIEEEIIVPAKIPVPSIHHFDGVLDQVIHTATVAGLRQEGAPIAEQPDRGGGKPLGIDSQTAEKGQVHLVDPRGGNSDFIPVAGGQYAGGFIDPLGLPGGPQETPSRQK